MEFSLAAFSSYPEPLQDLSLLFTLLDNEDVEARRGVDALKTVFYTYVRDLGIKKVVETNKQARLMNSSPQRPEQTVLATRSAVPVDYVSSDAIQVSPLCHCLSYTIF